jgi:copper chaperone CopZ
VHHQGMGQATVELKLEGMTCDGCVRAIERKLSRVAGVNSARVNLTQRNAVVDYDDARIQPEQLIGAVEQMGYHAMRA